MFERNHVGLEKLSLVAHDLVNYFPGSLVFAFYGELGSGKTTFIREICKVLHSSDTTTSPSFAIVNEYRTATGNCIYHFDFYRIKDIWEVFDLGYEDYFYSDNYCLIEWPEKIGQLLPENYIEVAITPDGDKTRTIKARSIK